MKRLSLTPALLFVCMASGNPQPIHIVAADFESPLDVKAWWVDNKAIVLSQCEEKDCRQLPGSGKCLRIRWDDVPGNKANTWLTDIKIDTFGNERMQGIWQHLKANTWLSFKVNTADADSVYFQFILFTKDEKDKWGSVEMTGFKDPTWKTVKIKLSDLHYANWGKGNIASPDLNTIIPARIEIGIRSAKTARKGRIDLRLDDIIFTDREP
jgi:hypothetical protein